MNNSCKLPICYPVSLENNDIITDSLVLETFESTSRPACIFDAMKYKAANGDFPSDWNEDALKNHYKSIL